MITDILNINGCVMKTKDGVILARLHEEEPACTIGMYFYLLDYLHQMGFEVR